MTALKVIERDRVTVFEGVPTMYVAMLNAGPEVADTSTLRLCVSGGAALPVEVLRGFEADVRRHDPGGLRAVRDLTGGHRSTDPDRAASPARSGRPIDGVEMRIVDVERRDVPTARSARSPSAGTT